MPETRKPIPEITCERMGASAVILSPIVKEDGFPEYDGIKEVCATPATDIRIFGKKATRLNRRLGVVLCNAPLGSDMDALRDKTKALAASIKVH